MDLVKSHGIPIIVCTSSFNKELRKEVWSKSIVDYVWKESTHFLEYLTALLQRIGHNENVKVLVVDDSDMARYHLCTLMKTHHYEVLEATSGDEALNILSENSDTTLVITDYDMPGMNGFELTDRIRSTRKRDDLAIIGISASNDDLLSARFLKSGANDFLSKPFSIEEFYCRVAQNVEIVQSTRALKQLSNTDALTQLYNRRYLFEVSKKLRFI